MAKPIQVFAIGTLLVVVGIFFSEYLSFVTSCFIDAGIGMFVAGGLIVLASVVYWAYERLRHPQIS